MKTNAVIPWKWHKDTDPVFLQDWFAESLKTGVLIKKNAKRSVRKITSPSGKVYFVKQECSFRNKAKKEYAAAAMLRRAGIPCIRFAALGKYGFRQTILISEEEQDTVNALEYFYATAAADPEKRTAFFDALRNLMAAMMQNGIRHSDFHAGNVLVRDTSGSCEMILVDPIAAKKSSKACPLKLAGILTNFLPEITDIEMLQVLSVLHDPTVTPARLKERHAAMIRSEWQKRQKQILSGNSKFTRRIQRDSRIFEVVSTPWYSPGSLPDDAELAEMTLEIVPDKTADERLLALCRARLEGIPFDRPFRIMERRNGTTVLYYSQK